MESGGQFLPSGGTVVFAGPGTQTVSGTVTFHNLTVQAGSTLLLQGGLAVNGTLTNNGTLQQTQEISGTSDVAFFDTGGHGGVVINAEGGNMGSTRVTIRGNQDCTVVPGQSVQRCFEIIPESPAGANATITFFFASSELAGIDCSAVNVFRVDAAGWQIMNALARNCSSEPMSVTVSGAGTFGDFVLIDDVPKNTIVIAKASFPAGGTGFHFSSDIPGGSSFDLDDGESVTFLDVPVGDYTVTERNDHPTDRLTGLTCADPDNESFVSLDTNTATIDLDEYETVRCTFANTQLVAIGNLIWADQDDSGTFDGGEEPLEDVDVELYSEGAVIGVDDPVSATTTDGQGHYVFDSVSAGRYVVHIPSRNFAANGPLAGWVSSTGEGADDAVDQTGDENGLDTPVAGGISSNVFDLQGGTEPVTDDDAGYDGSLPDDSVNFTADFGFRQLIAVHKHRPHGTILATWLFWYYIDVANTSTEPAVVVASDTLPVGIAPWSVVVSPGGSFDPASKTVRWEPTSLGPGVETQLWIRAQTYSWAAGRTLVNTVCVDMEGLVQPACATDAALVREPAIPTPMASPTASATPEPTTTGTQTVTATRTATPTPTSTPTLVAGTGAIRACAWEDESGDGVRQTGESPVRGLLIELEDDAGGLEGSCYTGGDGCCQMDELEPGSYTVTGSAVLGFFYTTEQRSDVEVIQGQHSVVSFGIRQWDLLYLPLVLKNRS